MASGGNENARSGVPFLAGEHNVVNVFSHLNAKHYTGNGILGFLNRSSAAALSQTSKRAAEVVRNFEWDNYDIITGSIADWHTTFPRAVSANLQGRVDLVDADFVYLRGIKRLNISGCTGITDRAFEYLTGVRELSMRDLPQITDDAIRHLTGVYIIDMTNCTGIRGNTFDSITGVHDLIIKNCVRVRGENFNYLTGIFYLDMSTSDIMQQLRYINSEHIPLLNGINTLDIRGNYRLNDTAFNGLRGLKILYMDDCPLIRGTGFSNFDQIDIISMRASNVLADSFQHLRNIVALDISSCDNVDDSIFQYLVGIRKLIMADCRQVTDAAFQYLTGILYLDMTNCNQPMITPVGIAHLTGIQTLITNGCTRAVREAGREITRIQGGGRKYKIKKTKRRLRKKNRRTQRR